MLIVGLTGGIGSGKSTVASALASRGAAVIDADKIAREVVEPGRPALEQLVGRFGEEILTSEGRLDRQRLADLAFNDPQALESLNRITHPAIAEEIRRQMRDAGESHEIVVLDIPLLSIATRAGMDFDVVVVVDAPEETALTRLVAERGLREDDARARMAAQMSREERLALADYVLDNGGPREELPRQLARLWDWLCQRAADQSVATQRVADGSPSLRRP